MLCVAAAITPIGIGVLVWRWPRAYRSHWAGRLSNGLLVASFASIFPMGLSLALRVV